ncbi:MAG: glycosyltransferase family 2 protein [Candidatus Heimdallarchaeota archaeon]|nr:glycosyltransferase family 2 protein [Candidatus Heimdallarchaeota archaeon]
MSTRKGPNVVVCLPVRNEEKSLKKVLEALTNQKLKPTHIFLTDDGSKDKTVEIAKKFELVTIKQREDRGFDVVGKIAMAKVANDCIEPSTILHKETPVDFMITLAGDIILPENYIDDLVKKFEENENLVVASGTMIGKDSYKSTGYMVPGPGRMFRYTFWNRIGAAYPLKQGWEAYPIHLANMEGLQTMVFSDIEYVPLRPTGGRTDFVAYGQAMKAFGYYRPLATMRAFKQIFMKKRGIKAWLNMLRGYYFSKPDLYEPKLRKYIRKTQKRRLRKLIFRF